MDNKNDIPWTITDLSNEFKQYGRRLSTYIFEFKEGDINEELIPQIIDLEKYSWKEICDACEGYYANMDELFALYGKESSWIIAECIFETENQ